ncbi:hypothetical protein HYW20_02940 [Candidatus Woesearchaeota archaeon]|nr:hypothetical protein [Candidatus Woesearchaeota archaeon]
MNHEFSIGSIARIQESTPQAKGLVLLIADSTLQERYRQFAKSGNVLMVQNFPEALKESSISDISAHIIYPERGYSFLNFAKSIRIAKGPAHLIVVVGDPKYRESVEKNNYRYVDRDDEDHINQVLKYIL